MRLLSVATMHYPPNAQSIRWFRDAVWPLVRSSSPTVSVDVVGTRPPNDLVRWGSADERVTVHGYLSEAELAPLFDEALTVIVPLQAGSGTRVKILEAMARGVPVVSTSIGAEGLDVVDGEHLLIADTPEAFSAAIQRLAEDIDLWRRLASAARARVLDVYDWRVCAPIVLEAIERLAPLPRDRTRTPVAV
jgi:glycosyltransferase involved in cell wall biosynthesis